MSSCRGHITLHPYHPIHCHHLCITSTSSNHTKVSYAFYSQFWQDGTYRAESPDELALVEGVDKFQCGLGEKKLYFSISLILFFPRPLHHFVSFTHHLLLFPHLFLSFLEGLIIQHFFMRKELVTSTPILSLSH